MIILNFIQSHGGEILQALAEIIAGASILANFTKTDTDNKAVSALGKAVHFLAANFFAIRK